MTKTDRTKASLEAKVTELYIRLHRRQTMKIQRKKNLEKRLEFFKNLLHEKLREENEIIQLNKESSTTDVKDLPKPE